MKRRAFLKAIGSAALLPILPRRLAAGTQFRRRRPSDPGWPSKSAWKQLDEAVGGNLFPVKFPLSILETDPDSESASLLLQKLKNPYYIGDHPGLTETLGWVDAWTTKPSVYAVAARNAHDIAAAVNFARDNNLRLVVRGGAHSYLGTSNAPDSLLIWTRHMNDVVLDPAFVPQGCGNAVQAQPAVTMGAGTIWMQAYDAVTTHGGRYVQGGGCTTVGVAGLIQGGGFGSFSKHYGLAAGSLLEAEVVTADGQIRVANACTNPGLFWALKGGGGGSFGVMSKLTVRTHELPEFFALAHFAVKAASDDAYRRLIRQFVSFYREHLFNDHWGEQVHVNPQNSLEFNMLGHGLDTAQARKAWQPFLDWVGRSPQAYSIERHMVIASVPARHFWDPQWWNAHWPELPFPNPQGRRMISMFDEVLGHLVENPVMTMDPRPGAGPNNAWWSGNTNQVGQFLWGFESLWLPASLLEPGTQPRLADALFAASRYWRAELHFNKGLAGAPPGAIAAARDTPMNPAVLSAFALAIVAAGQGPAYPGVPGHEPSLDPGRKAAARVDRCMAQLRALVPQAASYVNESNYFEPGWQQSYWGANYPRLAQIKSKYDPDGLFFVHNGVRSEQWSRDGFTRV
jgi:FAD/FMN-containing dehydrogenase